MNRRTFLAGAALAPSILSGAKNRSWSEIEKILARGDIKGKLNRSELPTPALLLDLTAFESNVATMTEHCRNAKRALRPHGKTHKCPEIAHALIRAGAVGACAAKLSEAEVFARHGVKGLAGHHSCDRPAQDRARGKARLGSPRHDVLCG